MRNQIDGAVPVACDVADAQSVTDAFARVKRHCRTLGFVARFVARRMQRIFSNPFVEFAAQFRRNLGM